MSEGVSIESERLSIESEFSFIGSHGKGKEDEGERMLGKRGKPSTSGDVKKSVRKSAKKSKLMGNDMADDD